MSNNEPTDRPPIVTEGTSEAGASAAGVSAGAAVATASGGDRERFPSPIVSIAAGLMNESTTTTTSTKTTPTPYSREQLQTMMSHAAETQSKLKLNQQDGNLSPTSILTVETELDDYANLVNQSALGHSPPIDAPFGFLGTQQQPTISSTSDNSPAVAVHNLELSLGIGDGEEAAAIEEDPDDNGKCDEVDKTNYDAWEDSDFNDLDDASLKKLLEEAYWYRNPGDRKNKSERFLQMLKKAEYDEEHSYRAIRNVLTRHQVAPPATNNILSPVVQTVSSGPSITATSSLNSQTNHRSSGSQRHKQGGSLQNLVDAAHLGELAITSSQAALATAAAEAAVNHHFNCDYQLSGGRMNRRQQQQHNNSNQNSSSSNYSTSSSASKRINKNSSVSARQREGGSLPSSVNQFETVTTMDAPKLIHVMSSGVVGGEVTPTTSTSAGTGSCLSLPETEAATQFDMDDVASADAPLIITADSNMQQNGFKNRWDISTDGKLWNIGNGSDLQALDKLREIRTVNTHSMTILGAKILEGLQQQQEHEQEQQHQQPQKQQVNSSAETKDASTVKEFLIDDALQFSVLELSAKNQQLQQQYPAVPVNVSGGAAGVPYPQTTEEQKRRLDAGYVSLNDIYTACSSVYGIAEAAPSDGDNSKTEAGGAASAPITTATVNGGGISAAGAVKDAVDGLVSTEVCSAKMGRILSATAAPTQAAKSVLQRQFDENGNAVGDGYGNNGATGNGGGCATSTSTNGNSNQFAALITTTVSGVGGTAAAAISCSTAGSTSGSTVASTSSQRQTLLSTGTNTTTTAMAAAAVAASISQLGAGPPQSSSTTNINATSTTITTTKLKSKKKSQQERNTIQYFVDTQTVAGCRGADPVEQLLKYIENDEKNNSVGQKKKERKKQSKLKKSNSLEELRSCSKIEVDDLNKYQAATTDMMRQKKGGGASSTSTGTSVKHNSVSVADISKNCNKEQLQQQHVHQQHQPASSAVQVRSQPRKSERRSWGTEELQYLGDQQQKEHHQQQLQHYQHQQQPQQQQQQQAANQMDWPPVLPKMSRSEVPLEFPTLAGMSEMDALNTVLSETAEFHVVTKKKKPKKQRAVTLDDATVGAANTGGNLQRMQPITKSASSNMMSQRVQQHYSSYYNQQPPSHVKLERQFVEKQQSASSHSSGGAHAHGQGQTTTSAASNSSHQDSSRRKSTSSMPPSEKSDSSDLDSVHSLPIQTGKKKSSRVNSSSSSATSAQAVSQRQAKQNNNSYNSPPAAISYADIARKRLEAALNNVISNTESSNAELFYSGKPSSKQSKPKPDFPELPGATNFILSTMAAMGQSSVSGSVSASGATLPHTSASFPSSASISYSQSLNATPASSSSDVEMASPELLPVISSISSSTTTTATTTASSSSSSSSSSSPPALQKSKSVENEASYSFNSSNLDQQYPALEMTVKRHSTSNVAMTGTISTIITNNNINSSSSSSTASSSSSYNFAAAAKQQVADKSTSAKLKAKPKEKTTINNIKPPSQEDASSVMLSTSTSTSTSASSSTSSSSSSSSSSSPVAATLKTTAATQTDRTKKMSGKLSGAGAAGAPGVGSVASSSSLMITSCGGAGRPAVIILNDDRDATHNEFIFGDFNEDELKMLNDQENTEKTSSLNQETSNKNNKVDKEEEHDEDETKEHLVKSKESSTDLSSDQLILNDSGAASDMVNMSSTLDLLSISGEAIQSSPNSAAAISNVSAVSINNSSTLSSTSSNSSSSASISSSASAAAGGAGNARKGGSGANQSNDSGIIANTSVNNFISKATSSDVLVSMQQLETCNDIETAIIAAARAAAAADAAKRSRSCSRNNSQDPEFLLPATNAGAGSGATPSAKVTVVNKSWSSATSSRKTTLPVYMAYQDGADDDESLHELSFMPDLNKVELAVPAAPLADDEPLAPTARQTAVMTNTDLIVDYIASTWNAIVKSKYVTFYSEEPEPES